MEGGSRERGGGVLVVWFQKRALFCSFALFTSLESIPTAPLTLPSRPTPGNTRGLADLVPVADEVLDDHRGILFLADHITALGGFLQH